VDVSAISPVPPPGLTHTLPINTALHGLASDISHLDAYATPWDDEVAALVIAAVMLVVVVVAAAAAESAIEIITFFPDERTDEHIGADSGCGQRFLQLGPGE
jgi:hypothetical protein